MNTPEQLQASAGEAAALLKAMSHPSRLLILCMLCDAPGTSAGELARMRDEGLIGCERQAQRIHYFITRPAVQQIVAVLKSIYCP